MPHPNRERPWWVLCAGVSSALHVALYVFLAQPQLVHAEINTPVHMEILEPPPPPPAPIEPPAPKPEAPRPKAHVTPQPKAPPPPPSNQPPPARAAPPAPVHIGLSLSSTVQGGAVAVPVGNTLGGKPIDVGDPNAAPLPGNGPAFVPSYQVSEAPEVDIEPDMNTYYPDAARKQELEGQVMLQLDIDATGRVTHATILHGAGNGFDEAALRAASEKLHFKPAHLNGHAVATRIDYKFTFLLD